MVAVPIVPIGALLGKADSAFKLVGGSSIVFNALRSRIFGKFLRVIEYPDGDLRSVKIHVMTIHRLRMRIAEAQPSPYPTSYMEPEDIRQIALFTSPHFTQQIDTDADVNALADNAWLFWSTEEEPIPKRGVKLDGSHINTKSKDSGVEILGDIQAQSKSLLLAQNLRRDKLFSRHQYDRVVDLAVDRDAGLLAIARNFDSSKEFRHHCLRLLHRRDPEKIVLSYVPDGDKKDEEEGPEEGDRKIEPQVELAGRE